MDNARCYGYGMTTTLTTRQTRQAERKAQAERIAAAQTETLRVVLSGSCPSCGSGLRRNLALAGWWQCEQYGAESFRKDATKPACSWQGFTA